MRWYAALLGVCALGALALGAGERAPAEATHSNVDVRVLDNSYDPGDAVIHVGDTVTWVNAPPVNLANHSVTECSDSTFSLCAPGLMPSSPIEHSGVLSSGEWPYGPITFTAPGTYYYGCTIHGASMSGRVIVEPLTSPTPIPPPGDPVVGGIFSITSKPASADGNAMSPALVAGVVALAVFALAAGVTGWRRKH